jgi:hypothetical protein
MEPRIGFPFERIAIMRVFLISLISAAVIATFAAEVMGEFQTTAALGFATSEVRL